MGITSPLQPTENTSNGNPVDDDGVVDDEGVDVELFALFMRSLKVPPRNAQLANTGGRDRRQHALQSDRLCQSATRGES